ncbi:MAG TPA: flagellar basal body P-ring formation chaperone FlgA [Paenirhodobacter sp.]
MSYGVLLVAVGLAVVQPVAGWTETVVAAKVIKARAIIAAEDLKLVPEVISGGATDPDTIVGGEARVAIYAGQPVRPEDVRPPSVIERNQRLTIAYQKGGLTILAEGRALSRGGIGDTIRVMNSGSKTTVEATIAEDGTAYVHSE